MKRTISKSPSIVSEYCASLIKIDNIKKLENTNNLYIINVKGFNVITSNKFKIGDYAIYIPIETKVSHKILSENNLYSYKYYKYNSNKKEVEYLLRKQFNTKKEYCCNNEITDSLEIKIKQLCGYCKKDRRIKLIKIKKEYSYGILFTIEQIDKAFNGFSSINFQGYLNKESYYEFDMINDELVIEMYLNKPIEKIHFTENSGLKKHYKTNLLNYNIKHITPKDKVTITNKINGSSFICGNVLSNTYFKLKTKNKFINKLLNKLYDKFSFLIIKNKPKYNVLYSSRNRIFNDGLNNKSNYYEVNIWEEYYHLLKDKISKDITIYGEIFGYVKGTNNCIQPRYDYKCIPGDSKLMIYRITHKNEDGEEYEYSVIEVKKWTELLINSYPELNNKIIPIEILYHGTLSKLYPDVKIDTNWQNNILEKLKTEKKFFMEEYDPNCTNKVYREGIVIRIDDDKFTQRAFKLKSNKFFEQERNDIDCNLTNYEY